MPGKIPQAFIDELLARVDIVEVIHPRVPLKKAGHNYVARCPFHHEKTPSFSVSPQKQFYYCFGCGASGSAIGFLMAHDHLTFPEAVESLASQYGMQVPRSTVGKQDPKAQQRQQHNNSILQLNQEVAKFYAQQLRVPEGRPAVAYLRGRKVEGGTASRFGLGFAPAGWDNLVKQFDQRLLLESGLAIKNAKGGIYDRFRQRLMFPIRNRRGQVVGFGGRSLDEQVPKYLNSPETNVFHKGREVYGLFELLNAVSRPTSILVVEGYLDVITLSQNGIANVVATLGTAATAEHVRLLFRYSDELIFCFDGDNAGRKAAWRALEAALPFMEEGRKIRFLMLPEGQDPDSIMNQEGGEAFRRRMTSALPLSQFFFDDLGSELNLALIEDRAALIKRASPLIKRLPEGAFAQMMRSRLTELTGQRGVKLANRAALPGQSSYRLRPSRLEEKIIALLLKSPGLIKTLPESFQTEALAGHYGELMAQVVNRLVEVGDGDQWTPTGLMESFRHTPHQHALRRLMNTSEGKIEGDPEPDLIAAAEKLQQRVRLRRLELLTKKSDAGKLSEQEREELRRLVARPK